MSGGENEVGLGSRAGSGGFSLWMPLKVGKARTPLAVGFEHAWFVTSRIPVATPTPAACVGELACVPRWRPFLFCLALAVRAFALPSPSASQDDGGSQRRVGQGPSYGCRRRKQRLILRHVEETPPLYSSRAVGHSFRAAPINGRRGERSRSGRSQKQQSRVSLTHGV